MFRGIVVSNIENIYSAHGIHLSETCVETVWMIQIFNRCNPVCDLMKVS